MAVVIVMSTEATEADIERVRERLREQNCRAELTVGVERTIITVVGPKTPALQEDVRVLPQVMDVVLLGKSYELAGRDSHPEATVVTVGGEGTGAVAIGGERLALIAGPGTVESAEQLQELGPALGAAGVGLLMGGSMRPDQSPYAFAGLGEEGLQHLARAGETSGLPVVEEVPNTAALATVARYADGLVVSAFNMSNFGLLEAMAGTGKPMILRRGLSATLDEWLLSAERVLLAGNPQVVLCESGIRTFETATHGTIDLSAIPALKRLTHLPVIADPARGSGQAALVPELALAAVAAGADGLMLEVHPRPERALADGPQSLDREQLVALSERIATLAPAVGRSFALPA